MTMKETLSAIAGMFVDVVVQASAFVLAISVVLHVVGVPFLSLFLSSCY